MAGNAEGNIDQIVFKRFFPAAVSGTCIEVGAARPDWLSIGALFRDHDWDVVSVEPNPEFAALHRARGNTVLEYACGSDDLDDVEFSVVDSEKVKYRDGNVTFESWSSLSIKPEYLELNPTLKVNVISVKLRRLETLIAQYRPDWKDIDIIAADVEGWELEVFSGLDFEKYRPKVLIVENLFCDQRYRRFFSDKGYRLWTMVQPNEVYVRSDLVGRMELATRQFSIFAQTLGVRVRRRLGRLRRKALGQHISDEVASLTNKTREAPSL